MSEKFIKFKNKFKEISIATIAIIIILFVIGLLSQKPVQNFLWAALGIIIVIFIILLVLAFFWDFFVFVGKWPEIDEIYKDVKEIKEKLNKKKDEDDFNY